MKAVEKWLFIICTILLVNGCAPLRTPVIVRNAPIEKYKYAYIRPTADDIRQAIRRALLSLFPDK